MEFNADPNSRDRDEPALFSAIYADRFDRIGLLDKGADINIKNGVDTPAIIVLARLRNYKYVNLFIERGAEVRELDAQKLFYLIDKYPIDKQFADCQEQKMLKQYLIDKGYQLPQPRLP